MEIIVSSLITGGLALVGVIISGHMSQRKIEQKLEIAQAVTDTKIEELTREVREHNNFARRMPVVESEIRHITEDIHELQGFHNHS